MSKQKLFTFIAKKIFMQHEGDELNKPSKALEWMLFPIKMIVSKNGFIKYHPLKDSLFIYDIEITREFFRALSKADDIKFVVEKSNGDILIRELKEE